MKIVRSRRLVGLAGCAALALGVAGTAGAVPASAQARVAAAVAPPPDVASWGLNNTGELGDGTTTDRSRYGDIRALDNVVRVAAGWTPRYGHTLAVRSDGTVWAWGDNTHGDLGDGTTTTRLSPVQVSGLAGVTQVAASCEHSLALRSDGAVWAWGGNDVGQLGVGTLAGHTTPVRVTQIGTVHIAGVAAGYKAAAILGTDGSVWARGRDSEGAAGLVLGAVTKVTDKFCNHLGTVMSQTPAAGTAVSPGTAVSVTIGQAPANGCP